MLFISHKHDAWPISFINLSFTKPSGTHIFYQGVEESAGPPCYLRNRCPHEHEILHGIRDTVERPRNGKASYIVINWLP